MSNQAASIQDNLNVMKSIQQIILDFLALSEFVVIFINNIIYLSFRQVYLGTTLQNMVE